MNPHDPLISADFGGWWQRSLTLLTACWKPVALVQGVATVAGLLFVVPATTRFAAIQRDVSEQIDRADKPDISLFFQGSGLLILAALAGVVFSSLGVLASAAVVISSAAGQGTAIGPALRRSVPRFPAMLGWSVVAFLLGAVALVLCLLPLIYVAAVLAVFPVVVLVDRGNAIGRCFSLFHADFGVSVSRVATIGGVSIAVTIATQLLSVLLGLALAPSTTAGSVAAALVDGLAWFASALVTTPMMVTAYADMRARREPFTTADLA